MHYENAMVIGASLAGMCAARVLADHFGRVTLLERDRLPETAESRPGVPQDRHVHVLLARGATIMSRLFPGIADDLVAAGAQPVDLTYDGVGRMRGRWLQRFKSGHLTYACSRVLLESVVRRRLRALPNVTIHAGARVTGLALQGARVAGVQVQWRNGRSPSVETADFIVDASGRGAKTADWLAALGYGEVTETVVDARLGYAGRRYRAPTDPPPDWKMMLIGATPPDNRRGGLIYGEEDGVWMVMLAGVLADYPPTDAAGFNAFAATVDPRFWAALQAAEPISGIIGYRQLENRLRHYEKLPRWPDRFVVMGDAVCGFNPIYGQGMTVAAMAAEALGETLAAAGGQLDGAARRFQRRYPRVVAPAWLLATSADLEWLGGRDAPSLADRLAGWYMPHVLDAIPDDRDVHQLFLEAQHLMQPPAALFRPWVALRLLRRRLRGA